MVLVHNTQVFLIKDYVIHLGYFHEYGASTHSVNEGLGIN